MKIQIGEKLKTPINAYVVEIETMYGDADGFGRIAVGGFKKDEEEEYLKDLLETCERMDEAYPRGRGGYDNYDHVEGFNKWFNIDDTTDEEYNAMSQREKELSAYWEYNPQCDGGHASFYGYKVFYYDENGVKYEVSVKLNN